MSYSYERYDTRRRKNYGSSSRGTSWGHWIPLAITVTVATAGIAAWIWKERKDEDDEDHDYDYNDRPPPGPPPGGFAGPPPQGPNYPSGGPPPPGAFGPPSGEYENAPSPGFNNSGTGQPSFVVGGPEQRAVDEEGIVSRMSGALRRTPSPQQIIDGASRRVAAGVAAVGGAVGGALASITEEDKAGYEDHSRWSEEADSQTGSGRRGPELRDAETPSATHQARSGSKSSSRKTVVIVVSAETDHQYDEDAGYHQEHASILSHLPEHVDDTSRVFVLIYDPTLKEHPLSASAPNDQKSQSMTSSYSNIDHEDAQSRGKVSPSAATPPQSKMFGTLYTQAQAIVDKETMIMPFTTPTGFVHMLRHLNPDTVYLQASLAGSGGDNLEAIKSWVGQIVLVVGDESGHGGLVDSEDERGEDGKDAKWWLDDARIGLGKGIEVVEGLRIGEDWTRRIRGHD